MKKISLMLLAICQVLDSGNAASAQQVRVNAQPAGQVIVTRASAPRNPNLIFTHRRNFRSLESPQRIVNSLINTRLFNGNLRVFQAETPAFRDVFSAIGRRPARFTGQGTIISNNTQLNANRERLRRNGGTFIFRGQFAIFAPIELGSNTTVWVDGKITYRGRDFVQSLPNDIPISTRGIFDATNKSNVRIFGTKRGWIDGRSGTRKLFGVFFLRCTNCLVRDLSVFGTRDGILLDEGSRNRAIRNFVSDCSFRGIWTQGGPPSRADGNIVLNNLVAKNGYDGIDIDGFSRNVQIRNNVIFHEGLPAPGSRPERFMIFLEVASNNNLIEGNVGIQSNNFAIGMTENGTNPAFDPTFPPTRNNSWINNVVFYGGGFPGAGISVSQSNRIDRRSLTFRNNRVFLDTRQLNQQLSSAFSFDNLSVNLNDLRDIRYVVRR